MDYEYYAADPYDPMEDIATAREVLAAFSPAYQEAEAKLAAFFRYTKEVMHPRYLFPLKAAVVDNIVLTRCDTPAALEATLLK